MLKHMQSFNKENSNIGYCEAMTYYHILLTSIFSQKELSKIKRYDCHTKEDLNNESFISIIALNLDNAIEYYMYASETNKYVSIPSESVEKLLATGFHSHDFHLDDRYSLLGFDEREF